MSSVTVSSPRRMWIVGPWWDLAYVVLTPLAIVPIVLVLVRRWFTPEQVSLAVIALASLGHHLPGFMRAYGDAELFARYRRRFLLAPPLLFAAALLFTPPAWLRNTFGLSWEHLHGLELVLFLWGTWHGLMQTFGFMRIYDIRRGVNDRWTAHLDHWLCLWVFSAGVAFSDARVYALVDGMLKVGLPELGPRALWNFRVAMLAAGALVAALYVANMVAAARRGEGVSWLKLLLIGVTGWFYWYCGRLSTNLLIGVAMFEIYHAVQYDAIVWIYNKRLLARAGERFGVLGFLFRDRWTMLGVYLGAIALYSSARFLTDDAALFVFSSGTDFHQWLIAAFATSSLLHFYYDGFIWKVSERRTQETLTEATGTAPALDRYVPAAVHAAKWALVAAAGFWLISSELHQPDEAVEFRDRARLEAIRRLVPDVPEIQLLASRAALDDGDPATAVKLAARAAALRPESALAKGDWGYALMTAGDFAAAKATLAAARAADPRQWRYATDLGQTLAALGENDEAERQLRAGIELAPKELEPRMRLAEFLIARGESAAAVKEIEGAMALGQRDPKTRVVFGTALAAAGEFDRAAEQFEFAAKADSQSIDARFQLGVVRLKQQRPERAVAPLKAAAALAPADFAIRMQLGDALFALGKWPLAAREFEHAAEINPTSADAQLNLGSALLQSGQAEAAERAYRRGLELDPESQLLRYNLGMLLTATGRIDEGQSLLESLPPDAGL